MGAVGGSVIRAIEHFLSIDEAVALKSSLGEENNLKTLFTKQSARVDHKVHQIATKMSNSFNGPSMSQQEGTCFAPTAAMTCPSNYEDQVQQSLLLRCYDYKAAAAAMAASGLVAPFYHLPVWSSSSTPNNNSTSRGPTAPLAMFNPVYYPRPPFMSTVRPTYGSVHQGHFEHVSTFPTYLHGHQQGHLHTPECSECCAGSSSNSSSGSPPGRGASSNNLSSLASLPTSTSLAHEYTPLHYPIVGPQVVSSGERPSEGKARTKGQSEHMHQGASSRSSLAVDLSSSSSSSVLSAPRASEKC